MSSWWIRLGSSQGLAKLTVNNESVRGEGGPHDPRLIVPVKVIMQQMPREKTIKLTSLTGSLHLVTSTNEAQDHNRIGPLASLNLQSQGLRTLPDYGQERDLEFRFSLTEALVARLEHHRQSRVNKDFSAVLKLDVEAAWEYGVGNEFASQTAPHPRIIDDNPFDMAAGRFVVLAPFELAAADPLPIDVNASQWLSRVLPGLGLDQLRLIEVALPRGDGPLPQQVIAFIDQARNDYDSGRFRECVQKCRDVRNAVEHHLGATKAHPVGAVIAHKVGAQFSTDHQGFVDQLWVALLNFTNSGHHLNTASLVTAPDAHACLVITAALVELINRWLSPPVPL